MPAIKAITLNNGVDDVVFNPMNVTRDGVAIFKDNSGSRPVAYPMLSNQVKEPGVSGTVFRTTLKVALPVTETITVPGSSGTTVESMYTLRCNLEFITPNQSTLEDRESIMNLVLSALSDADMQSTIVNLDHLY